jgi:hypothetical protein
LRVFPRWLYTPSFVVGNSGNPQVKIEFSNVKNADSSIPMIMM